MVVTSINKERLYAGGIFILIIAAGLFIAYKIVHIPLQLELVALFTAAAFYPIVRKPVLGIYLLFVVMPLVPHIRRLYYLLHQRPSVDPLIATGDIITMVTFTGLFFAFRERWNTDDKDKTIGRVILLYFCYLLLRVFFLNSFPPMEALARFRFYGPAVLLFFLGGYYAKNFALLRRIWIITIIMGALAALYAFKQLFYGYSEAEKLWFSSISFTTLFIKGIARPFSFFQAPASFADYMQLSIIGVVVIYNTIASARKYMLLPLIILYFYGALITSVRSNWIGIVLSLVIWGVVLQLRDNRKRIGIIITLFMFFFIAQLFGFGGLQGEGIDTIFSVLGGGVNQHYMDLLITERSSAITNPFEEYSLLSRVNLWWYIFDLSSDPIMAIFGRGVGVLNADSLYITYLAEFGYPGVIFIVWFVVLTIRRGFMLVDSDVSREQIALAKGIVLMNVVFAVINITGTHIHSFPGDIFFWFWNGVLIRLTASISPKLSIKPVK